MPATTRSAPSCSRPDALTKLDDLISIVDPDLGELLSMLREALALRLAAGATIAPWFIDDLIAGGLIEAKIDSALVYAYLRSGCLVCEGCRRFVPRARLAVWDAALDEWDALSPAERMTALARPCREGAAS